MRLQALSIGHQIDIWRPQNGVVHSAFARAINLLMEGELWTVVASVRQDAPFAVRLTPGAASLNVTVGEPARARAGYLAIGRLMVDCRAASRWQPAPWVLSGTGLEARLLAVEAAARSRAWPGSARIAGDVMDALGGDEAGSDEALDDVVRRSVGLGPGVTPSGDDVLVGILAVVTSRAAAAHGAAGRLARSLVPCLRDTSDVSRHLMDQALRGLPGRALHDLGHVLLEDGPDSAFADALARVLETGCTSGADACLGLVAACRHTFLRRGAAA